jgi:hypothetical protein
MKEGRKGGREGGRKEGRKEGALNKIPIPLNFMSSAVINVISWHLWWRY